MDPSLVYFVCDGFLRFNSGVTPADLSVTSIIPESLSLTNFLVSTHIVWERLSAMQEQVRLVPPGGEVCLRGKGVQPPPGTDT